MRDPEDRGLNLPVFLFKSELIISLAESDSYDRTQLDFGHLIQTTIQDTQNRIVFRAQTVIRDEIEGFVPKPQDLDYPAKNQSEKRALKTGEIPGTPLPGAPTVIDHDDNPSGNGFDTEAVFKGWYPTLRKCIWLLSRIYRLVNVIIASFYYRNTPF